ncbi:MAG: hypothetical protein ACI9CF_001189 [Candidatus Omnitrophota bacterium]|jgi:hypothetical protein
MSLFKAVIQIVLIIVMSSLAYADPLTGRDWLALNPATQNQQIQNLAKDAHQNGMPLSKDYREYTQLIQSYLTEDEFLAEDGLNNIFLDVIYEFEPNCRDAIDLIRMPTWGKS